MLSRAPAEMLSRPLGLADWSQCRSPSSIPPCIAVIPRASVGCMGEKAPYTQVVTWEFDIGVGDGYPYAITHSSVDPEGIEHVHVEETRKNGQEDTHCAGGLHRAPGGKWEWDVDKHPLGDYCDDHNFRFYHGDHVADGIREFLNEHGRPDVHSDKDA